MKQKLLTRKAVFEVLKQGAPAQIVRQAFRRDAPKAHHQNLQFGVVAVRSKRARHHLRLCRGTRLGRPQPVVSI